MYTAVHEVNGVLNIRSDFWQPAYTEDKLSLLVFKHG